MGYDVEVIRNRKMKKNRQCNGQLKQGWTRRSWRVSSSCFLYETHSKGWLLSINVAAQIVSKDSLNSYYIQKLPLAAYGKLFILTVKYIQKKTTSKQHSNIII